MKQLPSNSVLPQYSLKVPFKRFWNACHFLNLYYATPKNTSPSKVSFWHIFSSSPLLSLYSYMKEKKYIHRMQSQPTLSDCLNSFCFQAPSVIQNSLSVSKYPGYAWMTPKLQGTCIWSFLMNGCFQSHHLGELATTFPLLPNPNADTEAPVQESLTLYRLLPNRKMWGLYLNLKCREGKWNITSTSGHQQECLNNKWKGLV